MFTSTLRDIQIDEFHITAHLQGMKEVYGRQGNLVARHPNFTSKILFSDEAGFTRSGVFNSHNFHH